MAQDDLTAENLAIDARDYALQDAKKAELQQSPQTSPRKSNKPVAVKSVEKSEPTISGTGSSSQPKLDEELLDENADRPRMPLDGLAPLLGYLSSLEDRPCTLLDLGLAMSYASYPTNPEGSAESKTRPPIRIWSSNAFKRLMNDRAWIIDCLTVRSQAILREFLLEISRDHFPTSLKLEFLTNGSVSEYSSAKDSIVLVDFSIGRVPVSALAKSIRSRYPKGLAVLTGAARRESDPPQNFSFRPSSSAGPDKATNSPIMGHSAPSISSINSSKIARRGNKYVQRASVAELTAFAFETFRRQPSLIGDTESGRLFMSHPWHETSLGSVSQWPGHRLGYVIVALSVPTPIIMGLGPDFIQIYNDGYITISGDDFHPKGFGKPAAIGWGSIWENSVGPLVQKVIDEKKSFSKDDHLVWQQPAHIRYGVDPTGKGAVQVRDEASLLLLETYHTFSYSPLVSASDRTVDGYIALDIETTDGVVARRRLATARELQLALAPAVSLKQVYHYTLQVLENNPIDLPFVLLYSVHVSKPGQENQTNTTSGTSVSFEPIVTEEHLSNTSDSFSGSLVLKLQASCGLRDEHRSKYASFIVSMDADDQTLGGSTPFPLFEAMKQDEPLHTFLDDETANHFAFRSWESITSRAVVCPIKGDTRKLPDMVMIVGLNSRRIYKDIYRRWLEELARCLKSGLASAQKVAREQKLLRNLRKLDEAKTAFFTSVSHELRTPLTLIHAPATDALSEPNLSPANKNRFTLISKASNRLLRLVNSLLDFASVDAGRLQATFRPVLLTHYVEDLASLFRSAVERAGLTYSVETSNPDQIVYTDPGCIEKIIYNLISNALKYTSTGGIIVRGFCDTPTTYVIEVEDTGMGIPDDQILEIFKRFHRVDNKSARNIEGTGIGLALTKELSRVIHGDLTVESKTSGSRTPTRSASRYGSGSIFRVSLPLGYTHLPIDQVQLEESEDADLENAYGYSRRAIADEFTDAFEGQARNPGSGDDDNTSAGETGAELAVNREANILVVDDHEDLRKYIISILGSVCRSVTGVSNGEAALHILKTNARVDLVVSDIMMPKMDGFQLLSAIRSDETLAMMPVILLSARAGSEVTAEGIELGATDYLPKPFSSKELIARVRNALANAKNSRRLEALVQERTAELAASEKRAERLMGVLPVGVGYVLYMNEAFRRMSSWRGGKPFYIDEWYGKVRTEDRQRVIETVTSALRAGSSPNHDDGYVVDWQWDAKNSEATRNHCFGQLYPIGDSIVGVLTDITPSIRLGEQALQHEKQRARDAISLARSQESFLDVVSHELRNPLSAILNSADLCTANHEAIASLLDQVALYVSDEPGQRMIDELRLELDEAAESIQGIIASARHQSLIAGDILSVSKFNRGLLTVTPIDICLSRELRTILTMFEMQTRATSISLRLQFSPEVTEDLCICADPTRLTQILVNLISNSCRILENYDGFRRCVIECHALSHQPSLSIFQKGTDEGLGQLNESWHLPPDAPNGTEMWLLILVRDTGPGISAETQAHLFTKFNQAQAPNGSMGATRSAVGGGAGLGLYLAKKLAEMMGGSMAVKSVLGQGADFIFYLKTTKTKFVENKEAAKSRLRHPKFAHRTGLTQTLSNRSSFSTAASTETPSTISGDHIRTASPLVIETYSANTNDPLSPPVNNRSHLRVLVCEDNLLNQKLLYRQLTKAGIETIVANNGLEAIDKLLQSVREGRPMNVCLMDLEMPVCGGIEATTKIRALEREGELPGNLIIYAVTGNARGQHATACKEAGMDSTIVKPYDFKEMLNKLDSLHIA